MLSTRSSFKKDVVLVDPTNEVNAELWTLFAATTAFLAARLWCKITRRHGLWWDDHILIFSWVVTTAFCCYIKTKRYDSVKLKSIPPPIPPLL